MVEDKWEPASWKRSRRYCCFSGRMTPRHPDYNFNKKYLTHKNKNTMRAKFKCDSVTTRNYGSPYQEVVLNAVYAGDKNSEDNQFSQATPNGELKMQISNPAAIDFFIPGKNYYLDFQEAE